MGDAIDARLMQPMQVVPSAGVAREAPPLDVGPPLDPLDPGPPSSEELPGPTQASAASFGVEDPGGAPAVTTRRGKRPRVPYDDDEESRATAKKKRKSAPKLDISAVPARALAPDVGIAAPTPERRCQVAAAADSTRGGALDVPPARARVGRRASGVGAGTVGGGDGVGAEKVDDRDLGGEWATRTARPPP